MSEISGSHGGEYVTEVLDASITRALIMEAASTPETSIRFYQTTWRNNPEDRHFDINYFSIAVIFV
jgi:hypothetical protein